MSRTLKITFAPLALVLLSLAAGPARADTVIRFEELSLRPAHGVSLLGVTFGFTVGGSASSDALFGGFGPPPLMSFVECPCLEGNGAGTLTMSFDSPSSTLSFGLARSSIGTLNPGGVVELFDAASNSIGVFQIPTLAPPAPFAEGLFIYNGPSFSRAVLTFPQPSFRFALDNLRFNTAGQTAVPEPATLLLLGTGLAGVVGASRRHRKARYAERSVARGSEAGTAERREPSTLLEGGGH